MKILIIISTVVCLMTCAFTTYKAYSLNKERDTQYAKISQMLAESKADMIDTMIILVSLNNYYETDINMYQRFSILIIFTILIINVLYFKIFNPKSNEQTLQSNKLTGA